MINAGRRRERQGEKGKQVAAKSLHGDLARAAQGGTDIVVANQGGAGNLETVLDVRGATRLQSIEADGSCIVRKRVETARIEDHLTGT